MDNFLSEVKHNLVNLSSFSRIHIVIGNESCDLDSAVAAVTYALYLHTKNQREATSDVSSRETILTVPVLNILQSQFRLRTETTHFFKNCNIQASKLVFKDQIDLKTLYDENRLVLTLVDHNVLTGDYTRYEDCVIEVIDHRPKERPDDDRVRVKLDLVGSCCTLVAEELLDDPDFHLDETIAKLLYGTILVDTINRSPDAGKITERDENILFCLEEVLPNLEGDKLFNELQAAKFDISGLLNMEILEKDLKRVAGTAMTIAMSSVTMDMQELIIRPNFKEDLDKFCVQENCDVVVIMTLVNDEDGKPTRQIAVYSQNRIFRDQIADTLDNSEDIDLDLELVMPPFEEISVFQQGNVKASRKKVLPILKSFLVGDTTPDIASKEFVSVHTVSVPTDGFTSAVVPETPSVHFTLESIEEMSGRSSFEENADVKDLLDSDTNCSNKNKHDFDPLVTISSLDEESPSRDIPDDTLLGNSQNPFGDLGGTNSNKLTQNAREPSANFSSANLSSAHSSNIFDLGISDSELVDPFSSIDETVNQVSLDTKPKEIKDGESDENEAKDEDNNPFNIEVPIENSSGVKNAHSSNPFQDIMESADEDVSNDFVNFQLSDCDDEDESKNLFSKGDNSDSTGTSSTNPFSSGIFLEVDAYKSEHLLSYKSPSLIVECDDKSQADDLADLEESELFDKIPTPEIEHSGESSPFVMSGTGTPYEPQSEYHSRTESESGSGMPGMVVPPNSLMDQGFDDMDRQLPSFNNAEMVEKINLKKALLGDLASMEESAEKIADVSVPYTPANSFRDNSFENIMRENSLPNLLNDSEMLEKVQQKRNSLQANFDFTELSDTQSNLFESNPFRSSTSEENSSSLGTTLTSNDNPFFQLDGNTSDSMFGNQSVGVTSHYKNDTSDVFNLFGDTGESTNTSLDNQVGSKTGSIDFFDSSDFVTQSTQSGQSFNPFISDTFSSYDSASIPTNQTVDKSFDSTCDIDQENSENQSAIEVMNNSANLEAAGAVSESIAKEIIHNAIETFPDLKNPAVAESVFSNAEQDGIPFWTQQGSGDSGIGSTDSPQQAPKVKLQTHVLDSEVSVETEYLPGMDPLHGSQNIITSPLQSHSVETDADKEVVEGESFRKVSEAFLPEHSSFLLNQASTTQSDLPQQIREMIINKNIYTTAENIQSSTSVNKVVSSDEDTAISVDNKNSDLVAAADVRQMGIPKDKEPLVNTADVNANSLDISEESSKTEISNGVLDDAKQEVPVAEFIGDFLESGPVDKEVVDSQEHANDSSIDNDNDVIHLYEDSDKDLMNENVVSTIMSSGSDNSISSDASSSFQSTSESELITVRENTEKPSVITNTMFMEQEEENSDVVETSKHVDTESLENRVSSDMNEDLNSKEDEINYIEVADKLVKDTFTQVLEQEKARIVQAEKAMHEEEILEENLDTSDNVGIEMPENCNELSNVDKQFVVDKSDVVAEKTPVLINSFMTESALTIESISPAETPLEEHASGFYEVNPEDRHENTDDAGLSDSCYQTNFGENETGFYEFNNDAEENQEEIGSNKEHVGMNIRSYVDNALKLDSVINNDNTNLLMLNDDYSDASVSPLETPETEHSKGFYDINADNLELAIAKTEPLDVSSFLMADSTYSDSSMSPLDTPNTETVGGFYEFNTDVADKSEESVATQKQLGPDDAPEINIELVDSPVSSKDSFDSETESCFEETEIKHEGIINKSNDDQNNVTTKSRSVRFADSTKFPEELVNSTETVESQESDIEGFYELNAELQGDLLQNIDVGNPFSPIESPNEDVFALDYEINPCVPDLTLQNSDEECNDLIAEKSGVKFLNDDDEKENKKVEEMADFLVEVALSEAISTLHDEHSESIEIHQNKVSSLDNISDTENNVDDIAEEEPCDKKYDDGLFDVADQLVEDAMSSAIDIIQDMHTDSETFKDPVTGDSCRLFSDSSDSETSSTTTEGSYRIDHSSEVATPDRDGIAAPDINVTSTVEDFNNDEQNIDETLSGLSEANSSEKITGDRTIQIEDAENVELQAENVEQFMEENKENRNAEPETNLEVGDETAEFKSAFGDANEENNDNEVSHNLNDENGNVADDIHEQDISAEFDLDEEDTNTSRFDEDTNTSMDVKSPDGPTYYKYDSFELDDKDVSEKSKTLNRQGTIIPDIVISMDDSSPAVDETVKCRRLGNYKPEIIDLSHETEDEVSEKDDSFESDNVSETSMDTQLMAEETVEVLSSNVEGINAKKELSNVNCEDIDKPDEGTMEVASRILNDSNKDSDNDNKESTNNFENSNTDSVKYHNVKDLESEKQAKKGAKSKKVRENSTESTVTDRKDLGHDEYVTRKEIFYTSAGRLSVSIDSVVDHPCESETDTDAALQKQQKPVDDDDDLTTEQTDQIDKQNDKQKSPPMSQEKMKVMEETQEWHEDPIPGMGVTQESSTDESDTESESEYTKPARPDTLLNGARKKKKIAATNNLLTPDSTDDLVEGVDNIPTPDDLETPSDLDGELEWEDDTPITPASDSKKFVEYRDDEAEREKYENTKFRKVEIAGKDYRVDMKVIEPYKKVLSHGGYYGDGLNAIILFCGCYLPDRGRRDYQYVMDNLFLYVISTLELLVAEDYLIVYFHGATPRRQMPSFSWLKRCYQMIDRRLRKNLKGLLMVHPTLWLKTVVVMTKPFISSKFSSKLRFVKTLKELGKIVPMEYIYVPEPVSQYDAKLYQHRPCTSTPVTPSSSS